MASKLDGVSDKQANCGRREVRGLTLLDDKGSSKITPTVRSAKDGKYYD